MSCRFCLSKINEELPSVEGGMTDSLLNILHNNYFLLPFENSLEVNKNQVIRYPKILESIQSGINEKKITANDLFSFLEANQRIIANILLEYGAEPIKNLGDFLLFFFDSTQLVAIKNKYLDEKPSPAKIILFQILKGHLQPTEAFDLLQNFMVQGRSNNRGRVLSAYALYYAEMAREYLLPFLPEEKQQAFWHELYTSPHALLSKAEICGFLQNIDLPVSRFTVAEIDHIRSRIGFEMGDLVTAIALQNGIVPTNKELRRFLDDQRDNFKYFPAFNDFFLAGGKLADLMLSNSELTTIILTGDDFRTWQQPSGWEMLRQQLFLPENSLRLQQIQSVLLGEPHRLPAVLAQKYFLEAPNQAVVETMTNKYHFFGEFADSFHCERLTLRMLLKKSSASDWENFAQAIEEHRQKNYTPPHYDIFEVGYESFEKYFSDYFSLCPELKNSLVKKWLAQPDTAFISPALWLRLYLREEAKTEFLEMATKTKTPLLFGDTEKIINEIRHSVPATDIFLEKLATVPNLNPLQPMEKITKLFTYESSPKERFFPLEEQNQRFFSFLINNQRNPAVKNLLLPALIMAGSPQNYRELFAAGLKRTKDEDLFSVMALIRQRQNIQPK